MGGGRGRSSRLRWVLATGAILLWSQAAKSQAAPRLRRTPLETAAVEIIGRDLSFGLIVGTAITADGSLLLVDRGESRVLRVSPDGSLRAIFGRAGDGPGEFRFPYRVAERSDGSIVVYDLANRRFSEFDASGRFVRRWTTSAEIVTIDAIVPLSDGRIAVSGVVRSARASGRAIHVFDSTFRHIASFGDLPPARSRELQEQWGAGYLCPVSGGALLFTRRIPYELHWYSAAGEHLRQVTIPKPVSEFADDAFLVRGEGSRRVTEINRDLSYPLSSAVLPGGRVLAGRFSHGKRYWDLIDAQGRLVWSGDMPPMLTYFIGADESRNSLWYMGQLEEEPVLVRIRPAVGDKP